MKVHKKITSERLIKAVERSMFELDSPGFCIACGDATDGVEPDAQRYPCRRCGERSVYGAEELLMMGVAG
jgi:hypothetical protein